MSLRVWLPLTKDLKNQGLDDVAVTNNGATFNSIGKLGGCYSFGTDNSYITVDSTPLKTFTEFSFACWVKIISWNKSYSTIFAAKNGTGVSWNNLIFSLLRNSSNSTLCFNIAGSGGYTSTGCQTGTLSLNTWYHITCTYKSGQIKLYQDGNVVNTYSTSIVPSFSSIANLWIGKSNESSYQSNNLLNDVRIYDHCLSPLEVKKLAQGLVLHYPLNRQGWGQENLVHNSNQFRVGVHATGVTPSVEEDGTYKVIAESGNSNYSSSWWKEMTGIEDEFVEGESFTVSFWIKSSNANKTNPPTIYLKSGMGYYSMKGKVSANYSQVYYTGTWKKTNSLSPHLGWSRLVGTYYICQWKIEKGTIPTPWCPNSSDTLATMMGLNSTTEYDCSGFCNNGTRTGTFTWTSDTPKYSVSQYFNGSSYILTDSGTFSWFDFDKCTIAVWMKPTTTPASWAGTFGIAHNNSASNKSFVIGNYGGKFTVQSANGNWVNIQSSTLPVDEWHHCVATLDGTTIKMYFDGELVNTYITSWGSTTVASDTRVQVGNDLPGSDEIYQGYYSDARIYATALSADDVLDLYNNTYTVN